MYTVCTVYVQLYEYCCCCCTFLTIKDFLTCCCEYLKRSFIKSDINLASCISSVKHMISRNLTSILNSESMTSALKTRVAAVECSCFWTNTRRAVRNRSEYFSLKHLCGVSIKPPRKQSRVLTTARKCCSSNAGRRKANNELHI